MNNLSVLLLLLFLFSGSWLFGTIVTTVTSGQWDNPAIWNTGSVPTSLDDVRIVNGDYVAISGFKTVNSLEILGNSFNQSRLKSVDYNEGTLYALNGITVADYCQIGNEWVLFPSGLVVQ